MIFGITSEGKAEIQTYRFAKEKFTAAQAREWLKEHNITVKSFEPAEEKKGS